MNTNSCNTISAQSTPNSNAQLPTDEELMSRIQQRDAVALELLYQRYRPVLKSAIQRVVNDDASAEDVLQDCLVELWRHAHHFSAEKGRVLGWVVTLAKRRAIDHIRRSMSYSSAKDRMETEVTVHITLQDAATDCEDADLSQVLHQHLRLLPVAQQEVINLAFLQGMSQREVAAAAHLPLGTVKTRIELGLKKLRDAFRTRNAIHSLQAA